MNIKITLLAIEIKSQAKKNDSASSKNQTQSQTINNNIKIAQK